ncbi:hypothetical protein ACFFWD_27585 [Bradyrhizobium erythrophlei]|uniref:hypothetical protein n=1 Tax=Bradyrhizobium erythrophlei TaxID=1437360 RepID=UPI0035E93616
MLGTSPISQPGLALFQVEADMMQPTYSSGTTSVRLQALIADLRWRAQLFNSDIADEEQKARVFNVSDVAYPLIARDLRERRDKLVATIATLETRLKDLDPLARAA